MREADHDRRLDALLAAVAADNPFYREKYRRLAASHPAGRAPEAADFAALPFTTKEELAADQAEHPPFGSNLTLPLEDLVRSFPEIGEFDVEVDRRRELAELVIRIEVAGAGAGAVAAALAATVRRHLALRPRVEPVAPGTLPRYVLKARRFRSG